MSIQTREVLKTYFETGDYPTEAQFSALIDSLFHKTEDSLPLTSVDGLTTQLAALRSDAAVIRATLTGSYMTRAQVLALLQQTNTPVAFVEQLPEPSADTMNRLYIVFSANGFTANVTGKTKLSHASGCDEGDILGTWDDFVEGEVEVGQCYLDDDLCPGCVMQCTAIENDVPQWTVAEEQAVGDYVWTRDGKCYELVFGRTWDEVADPYTYAWIASHTPAQTAAIEWAVQKRAAELQEAANAKWVVDTAVAGQGYYADVATSTTMTVTVTTRFNGTLVDCNTTPSGWTRTATGTYTRSVSGASGTVPAATFGYTVVGGTYDGLTVSKSSSAKSITVTYPAWYGFSPTADFATLDLSALTRRTSNLGTTSTVTNATGNGCYLWIVTHGSASATSMNLNILATINSSASFPSPDDADISLSGYKVYRSNLTYDLGSFGINMAINV